MSFIPIERRNNPFVARSNSDRRTASFPNFKYWGRRGRRRQIRRCSDQTETYLDWYPTSLLWVTVVVVGLCAADAALTLTLLQRGAVEINPFMAMLIDTSSVLFVGVKMAVTGLGLIYLVVHQNFTVLGVLRVRKLVYASLGLYVGTLGYEGMLLFSEPLFSP
jgi:hypothetical protein